MNHPIKQGELVRLKAQWRATGEDDILYRAVDDEGFGRLLITPAESDLQFPGTEMVQADMLVRA